MVLWRLWRWLRGRREEVPPPPPPPLPPSERWKLGADMAGNPWALPKRYRQAHAVCVGTTGAGKSTWFYHQLVQHAEQGDGVMLLDPHGDLTRDFLASIPGERRRDVIYVNPQTAVRKGKLVQINFLDITDIPPLGDGPGVFQQKIGTVTNVFLDALSLAYPDFWGPRLEGMAKNAILLQFYSRGEATVKGIWDVLSSAAYREDLLRDCTDELVRKYWFHDFLNYPPEAKTSVPTKLMRLIQEPSLGPMFDTTVSSFSFLEAVNKGKILVVYLPQAVLSTSSVSFLGSLFLHRIYQVGLAREEVREGARTPFYVYADEASLYITAYLRALLQTMRKYKVFFTFATQSLSSFNKTDRTVADTLVAQCDVKLVFRCQPLDADIVSRYFPPTSVFRDNLPSIPHYQFVAIVSSGESTKFRLCSTYPLPPFLPEPDETIEASLSAYGREYDFSRAEMPKRVHIPEPELTPCQYLCLVEIARTGKRGTQEDRVAKALKEKFGFAKVEIFTALRFLANARYVDEVVRYEDEAGRPTPVARYFKVANRSGLEMLYPPLSGARLGGMAHARLLGEMMKECQERGWGYVLSDHGGKELVIVTYKGEDVAEFVTAYPDMLVYPLVERTGEGGVTSYSAGVWDAGRRFAVEVELDPLHHGHITRVLAHWRRNEAMGLPTLFVVNSEEKAAGIRKALEEAGATVVRDVSKARAGEVSVRVVEVKPLELTGEGFAEECLAKMMAAAASAEAEAAKAAGAEGGKGEEGGEEREEEEPAPSTPPTPVPAWKEALWGREPSRPKGEGPPPAGPSPAPAPSPPLPPKPVLEPAPAPMPAGPLPSPEPAPAREPGPEPSPAPEPPAPGPPPSPEPAPGSGEPGSGEAKGAVLAAGERMRRGGKALEGKAVRERIRRFLKDDWTLEKRKDGRVYARKWDPATKKVVRRYVCTWTPELRDFVGE